MLEPWTDNTGLALPANNMEEVKHLSNDKGKQKHDDRPKNINSPFCRVSSIIQQTPKQHKQNEARTYNKKKNANIFCHRSPPYCLFFQTKKGADRFEEREQQNFHPHDAQETAPHLASMPLNLDACAIRSSLPPPLCDETGTFSIDILNNTTNQEGSIDDVYQTVRLIYNLT
jgi:hypothetical protein